jgi:hypothetical protein
MADQIEGPPTKRPRLNDPLTSPNDNPDLFGTDAFDLEKHLPDELLPSTSSWPSLDPSASQPPPPQNLPLGIQSIQNTQPKFPPMQNGEPSTQQQMMQGMIMPNNKANLLINKQPTMNNNMMMGKMVPVPNGPMMQRGIRNQQSGNMTQNMGPQRHQCPALGGINSNYAFSGGGQGPPTIQRMLQPAMGQAPMQPPPRYPTEDFITQNPPPNVVVSTAIQVTQQPQQSQISASGTPSSMSNTMVNSTATSISSVNVNNAVNNGGTIVPTGVTNQVLPSTIGAPQGR